MRILVFMSDNRPLQTSLEKADYSSLVASINYEYSKIHNYDFLYYRPYLKNKEKTELYNCKNPSTKGLRHAAWSKLLSTSLALELDYDYVVYIDTDCIFKDYSQRLEDYIQMHPDKDIIFLNNKPWGDTKPCSGFYICAVNDRMKQFLRDWYAMNIPVRDINHAWEQEALWKMYMDQKVGIVDSWMFKESEGQFLRHITNTEKPRRTSYFSAAREERNIDYEKNIREIQVIEFDTDLEDAGLKDTQALGVSTPGLVADAALDTAQI